MPSKSFTPSQPLSGSLTSHFVLVRPFDDWVVGRTQSLPFSALKGAVVGIDASHFIEQHLINVSTREALLGALGGFPFALRSNIEKELQTFKNLGVGCIFVFNGLEFGKKDNHTAPQSASRSYAQAWELYDQQQADRVVDAFSNAGMMTTLLLEPASQWTNLPPAMLPYHFWSQQAMIPGTDYDYREPGTPPPETLYKFLQRILNQNGVSFMVAPYSAAAQVGRTHEICGFLTQERFIPLTSWTNIALLPCSWRQSCRRCSVRTIRSPFV